MSLSGAPGDGQRMHPLSSGTTLDSQRTVKRRPRDTLGVRRGGQLGLGGSAPLKSPLLGSVHRMVSWCHLSSIRRVPGGDAYHGGSAFGRARRGPRGCRRRPRSHRVCWAHPGISSRSSRIRTSAGGPWSVDRSSHFGSSIGVGPRLDVADREGITRGNGEQCTLQAGNVFRHRAVLL